MLRSDPESKNLNTLQHPAQVPVGVTRVADTITRLHNTACALHIENSLIITHYIIACSNGFGALDTSPYGRLIIAGLGRNKH